MKNYAHASSLSTMTIPRLLLLALLILLAPLASAAVSSTTNQVSYTGTGSNSTFSIPFYYFQNSDIVATENNFGTITTLALTTDYTLVNNGIPGGTLTLTAGNLTAGIILTIQRDPVLTQTTYFSAQGPLPPAAIGNALDLLCMQVQAARQTSSRALQLPLGDIGTVTLPTAVNRANQYLGFDSSGNAIPIAANNASGTAVTATGSTTPRLLADRFSDLANVMDYGAIGNGTTDDTAAIQAAINTGKSVFFPGHSYKVSSTLTMNTSGQFLFGVGIDPNAGSTLVAAAGTYDVLVMGNVGGSRINGPGINKLRIDGTAMTGGNCIHIENVHDGLVEDCNLANPYEGIDVQNVNIVRLSRVDIQTVNGPWGIKWDGTAAAGRSDILDLSFITINGGGAYSSTDGILWDGNCNSMSLHAVRLINCTGNGFHITDTSMVGGNHPAFLLGHDLEIDFANAYGFKVDTTTTMEQISLANIYVNGQSSQTGDGIYIGSGAQEVTIAGGKVTGSGHNGVNILGSEVTLSGMTIALNSQATSNTYDGVVIASGAANVTVTGCEIGTGFVGAGQQRYGVNAANGATFVSVVGNSLQGNATGAYLSGVADGNSNQMWVGNTGSQTGYINNVTISTNGTAPTLTSTGSGSNVDISLYAKGSGAVHLGNGNGDSLLAGSGTASLVNAVKVAGSATGSPVSILSSGSDTNVDIQIVPQGIAYLKYGTFTGGSDRACNGSIPIKTADGTIRYVMLCASP